MTHRRNASNKQIGHKLVLLEGPLAGRTRSLPATLGLSVSAGLLLAAAGGCSVAADGDFSRVAQHACETSGLVLTDDTRFYVPPGNPDAKAQIKALKKQGMKDDARLIKEMVETPHSVWLEHGSPKEVKQQAKKVVEAAAEAGVVPVLVVYNIPFRDCAQFSAGGATSSAEYKAWIDGIVAGIGERPAVVILEPDGLGIIPFYNPFSSRENWLPSGERGRSGNGQRA